MTAQLILRMDDVAAGYSSQLASNQPGGSTQTILAAPFPICGGAANKLGSPLLSIVLGPTRIEKSSLSASWNGIILERHQYSPGERNSASTELHVISVASGTHVRFDYRNPAGDFSSSTLSRAALMITPAGLVPDIRLPTCATFTHCALEDAFLRSVANEVEPPCRSPTFHPAIKNGPIERIVGMLTDELEAEHPAGPLYVDSLAHALAARYLLLDSETPLNTKHRVSGFSPRIANRIREKIEANLDTTITLDDLARESGYSRGHFLRMFRATTGLTPHQYILDLRLRRAREHLRQANASIIDVALSCGFSSQAHMTTVFRRHLHVTPGQFRRSPQRDA